jgi:hypothetical protein
MEKFCTFPGCQGGCHWCSQIKKQRAEASLYRSAIAVLLREGVDTQVRSLALFVEQWCRPRINEKTRTWLPDVPPPFLAKPAGG